MASKETKNDDVKGHCNCGAITVSIAKDAFPSYCGLCHCLNCRASSGSLFSLNLPTATKYVKITGAPKIFVDKDSESGNTVNRHFCSDCGTAIMSVVEEKPDVAYVKGGPFSKAGVELPAAAAHVFWKRREKWEVKQEGAKYLD